MEGASLENILTKERVFDRFLRKNGYIIKRNNGVGMEKVYILDEYSSPTQKRKI